MAERPVLLCYDGSEESKRAIWDAAALLAGRPALVLTVFQDSVAIPPFAWAAPMSGIEEFVTAARDAAHEVAGEGARIATEAGFRATPLMTDAAAAAWPAIVAAAEERDAAVIVMGSRGLGGVKSALLGSVSANVVHHATKPVLIARHRRD